MCGSVFTVRAASASLPARAAPCEPPWTTDRANTTRRCKSDPAIPVFTQYDCTISQNYTRGFLHVASSSLVLCLSRVVLGTGCEASATSVQEMVASPPTLSHVGGVSPAQCAAKTTCLWRRLGGLATDCPACFQLCSSPCRHVERWTFSRADCNYHHDKLLTQDRSFSHAASRRTSLPTLPTHGRPRPPSGHRPEGPRRRGTGQTCLLRKFLGPGNTRALAQTIATRQSPLHAHHSQGAVVAKANGKLRQLHVLCPFWCTPSGSNNGREDKQGPVHSEHGFFRRDGKRPLS